MADSNGRGDRPALDGTKGGDVAEEDHIESTTEKTADRFRAVFEEAALGIAMATPDGHILEVNPAFARILGRSAAELSGRHLREFTHPDDLAVEAGLMRQLVSGDLDHFRLEKRFLLKGGLTVWGNLNVSLVRDSDGGPRFVVTVLEDIVERKRLEEQLLRAQKLETAGRIAGQVAHDFNNLLGPLALYPDLIRMQLPDGHPATRYCDTMLQAVQQMADINSDMLALARRAHSHREPADLNNLVRQAVDQMGHPPESLAVRLELDSHLPPVQGASAQLLRVISNLLVNAREAMEDRGTITIKTNPVWDERGQRGGARSGPAVKVLLSVSDTGPGIRPDVRDKIFDPFFSTKAGSRRGTGLGLSIVQAVAEDHGGHVEVTSVLGKGSRFTVYLPASIGPMPGASAEPVTGGRERILIVDDDHVQRQVVADVLTRLGYRVETAASGEQALELLASHGADIIIADLVMPGGIDGVETFQRAKEICPGLRAIIISGVADAEGTPEVRSMGAGAFLRKPVRLEKLTSTIREELDRRGGLQSSSRQ